MVRAVWQENKSTKIGKSWGVIGATSNLSSKDSEGGITGKKRNGKGTGVSL